MTKSRSISNYELMERVKYSDHCAFKLLYERLWEILYIKAYSILGNKNIAEDIVQDVWISLWERRAKVDNDNIVGYLIRAVRFRVYNEFRGSKYRNKLIEEFVKNHNIQEIDNNNIEQYIQLKDTKKCIFAIVDDLPKKCKHVFKLSRFNGLKNHEIAQKLNISQRTVETHISNALKVLKNNIVLCIATLLRLF